MFRLLSMFFISQVARELQCLTVRLTPQFLSEPAIVFQAQVILYNPDPKLQSRCSSLSTFEVSEFGSLSFHLAPAWHLRPKPAMCPLR